MRGWDDGVMWHLELVTVYDWDDDPLSLDVVRDEHLRVTNGNIEDDYIESLIKASYRQSEAIAWRAFLPQTWKLVLNRFPCGAIVLPKPPCIEVESITYLDEDGAQQTWGGSPLPYDVTIPKGPMAGRATITPIYDTTFPDHRVTSGSVNVTFRAGYLDETVSPPAVTIPEDVTHARQLWIGEMYKQRSDSVHAFNQNPAVVRSVDLWKRYRAW